MQVVDANGTDLTGLPDALPPLYEPLAEPCRLEISDDRELLRIGSSNWTAICVDALTGEVWSVASLVPPGRRERWQDPRFMNSEVAAFGACLDVARRSLPVTTGEGDTVARAVRDKLRSIDPPAMMDVDSFWNGFCDEVSLGDWGEA